MRLARDIIRGRLQRRAQRILAGCGGSFGGDMGGHERVTRAGDPGDQNRGRHLADQSGGTAFTSGPAAIGDQDPLRAARQQGLGGFARGAEFRVAQQPGLFQIDIKRCAVTTYNDQKNPPNGWVFL